MVIQTDVHDKRYIKFLFNPDAGRFMSREVRLGVRQGRPWWIHWQGHAFPLHCAWSASAL